MAQASIEIIEVLKSTARKLIQSKTYQWGHMGSCNCGFLAQEITNTKSADIHKKAMQKYGDWNDQLNDYCPTSGLLMDDLITNILDFGFDSDDLKNLEKLSDTSILQKLPAEKRYLTHNKRDDVVLYLNTWARLLEDQLIDSIYLTELKQGRENQSNKVKFEAVL